MEIKQLCKEIKIKTKSKGNEHNLGQGRIQSFLRDFRIALLQPKPKPKASIIRKERKTAVDDSKITLSVESLVEQRLTESGISLCFMSVQVLSVDQVGIQVFDDLMCIWAFSKRNAQFDCGSIILKSNILIAIINSELYLWDLKNRNSSNPLIIDISALSDSSSIPGSSIPADSISIPAGSLLDKTRSVKGPAVAVNGVKVTKKNKIISLIEMGNEILICYENQRIDSFLIRDALNALFGFESETNKTDSNAIITTTNLNITTLYDACPDSNPDSTILVQHNNDTLTRVFTNSKTLTIQILTLKMTMTSNTARFEETSHISIPQPKFSTKPTSKTLAIDSKYLYTIDAASATLFIIPWTKTVESMKPKTISISKYMDTNPTGARNSAVALCVVSGKAVVYSQKAGQDRVTVFDGRWGSLQTSAGALLGVSGTDVEGDEDILFGVEGILGDGGIVMTRVRSRGKDVSVGAFLAGVKGLERPVTLCGAIGRVKNIASASEDCLSIQQAQARAKVILPIGDISVIPMGPPLASLESRQMKAWQSRVTEWMALDSSYLLRLLTMSSTRPVVEFEAIFMEWVKSKTAFAKSWGAFERLKANNAKDAWKRISSLNLLPHIVSLLVTRILENDEWYPRNVVLYLVRTGCVDADTLCEGGDQENKKLRILEKLAVLGDFSLVRMGIGKIRGVTELDLIRVVQIAIDVHEATTVSIQRGELVDLVYDCFTVSRNDSRFVEAMRTLTGNEVSWLLDEFVRVVDGDLEIHHGDGGKRRGMAWWVWGEADKEYKRYVTAVEALCLVIDAGLSTICLNPVLKERMARLAIEVSNEIKMVDGISTKLAGPLATVFEGNPVMNGNGNGNVKEGGGKNWTRMVKQMALGVGEYALEVTLF